MSTNSGNVIFSETEQPTPRTSQRDWGADEGHWYWSPSFEGGDIGQILGNVTSTNSLKKDNAQLHV